VLRDNVSLTRAANVEFDLEEMFDGDVFADFKLLFLLCHESRVEIPSDGKPEDCWLEKWSKLAVDQGIQAREKLRFGVESAIKVLGAGFLTTKGNAALRERLGTGGLAAQDYYRQLLRMVYRLLLLLVAEEKKDENGLNLLHPPGTPDQLRQRYAQYYSVGRLRTLAGKRRGTTHTDLYDSLKLLFLKLRTGYEPLGIPGLGSFLFSPTATPDLDSAPLANESLLEAIRALCITDDTTGRGGVVRRPVDFADLGSDELGSVYESLLELHPKIGTDEGPFSLGTAAGHERKTTGSYYTPTALIDCLLDSALDPVAREALNKPTQAQAEKALLSLKICDPACGSGHFLISAAERLAKYLASLRTGDEEPSTLAVQHAKRDIIGRCIYGVDINPMAVELCQVALWMEALDPGRPFSFLEHHIQCGNSLLGTTPALLQNGIPDEAFTAIEGDVKARVSALKKQNKQERKDFARGQGYLDYTPIDPGNLSEALARVDEASGETAAGVAEKARRYAEFVKGNSYQHQRLLADTWCAAFVWKKDDTDLGKRCPTEQDFRKVESHAGAGLVLNVCAEVERLRNQYQFFHWHIAFPDVFGLPGQDERPENEPTGWSGGFDVVLGNPPWERIKLEEQEWFAERRPDIANARNAAERRRMIEKLRAGDPVMFAAFLADRRKAEGESHIIRDSSGFNEESGERSGMFPLCGRGDVNTYSIFAELNRSLISSKGRIGCIVPSGVATDDTTKLFFQNLVETKSLVSLFDFENRELIFPAVAPVMKFCLLTTGSPLCPTAESATFAFFATRTEDLADEHRRFTLSANDIALLNPNTRTCATFRSRSDAELNKAIYRRAIALIDKRSESGNRWNIKLFAMFHMTNDAEHFRARDQLEHDNFAIHGSRFIRDSEIYEPLYEAKLVQQFDHRHGTFDGLSGESIFNTKAATNSPTEVQLADAEFTIVPRYWVLREVVEATLSKVWTRQWSLVFRDIIQAMTNARCGVFTVIPRCAVSNKLPLILPRIDDCRLIPAFVSALNSFVFDYCVRQKIGGTSLNFFILEQLPVLPPEIYSQPCPWAGADSRSATDWPLFNWLLPRVLELTFTARDLEPFARDCGYAGPPFRWHNQRRFLLRAELDAAFFHLYLPAGENGQWRPAPNEKPEDLARLKASFPTPRDAVSYIMNTFPIVRRKDEEKHDGDYRTKRVILEIYDAMQEAIRAGQPYQTRLDPPPGPPNEPLPEWKPGQPKPADWPSHIHPPRGSRATPPDEWHLSDLANGATLPRSFKLMLEESEAAGGIERHWKGKLLGDGDGLPETAAWVLVRHPDLKRGNTSVPVALGKLTYQELKDGSTKQKVMVVTLRGPVPPAQVRVPLEDWPSFRPLAVLEPLDS